MADLTEERRAELVRIKAEAKLRCRELVPTIRKLEEELFRYRKMHCKWKRRYEDADRELATYDKLTIVTCGERKSKTKPDSVELIASLDKEAVIRLANKLGLNLEEGGEKDGM